MEEEFPRIKRLPPYVFNVTGELKQAARRRGEDVIDFSMGNPDGPTPQHIVDKLIETIRRRAACLSSPVTLNTYGGNLFILGNSSSMAAKFGR